MPHEGSTIGEDAQLKASSPAYGRGVAHAVLDGVGKDWSPLGI